MKRLTIKQRVANGARWLDENFPGWEQRITIDTLDLESPFQCICGQVFVKNAARSRSVISGYRYAENNLFSEANSWITQIVDMDPVSRRSRRFVRQWRASKVGWVLGFSNGALGYKGLQREWKHLLRGRAQA